jgi:hypothetical protein
MYKLHLGKWLDIPSLIVRVSYTALICLNLMLLGLVELVSSCPKKVSTVMALYSFDSDKRTNCLIFFGLLDYARNSNKMLKEISP